MGKTRDQGLPAELFHLLAALTPEFMRLLERCDLKGVEFVALLYLRHEGRDMGANRFALLQKDFREGVLKKEFNYSPGDTDVFLNRMEEKELLRRQRLSPEEKKAAFGTAKGRRGAVILLPKGISKIDEVKGEVNRVYVKVLAQVTPIRRQTLLLFVSKIETFATELLRALQKAA